MRKADIKFKDMQTVVNARGGKLTRQATDKRRKEKTNLRDRSERSGETLSRVVM